MLYANRMKWRAPLLVALAAAFAVPSFASFELVLVADRSTRKIHRFDGTTGAYFGAFGNFTSGLESISIDQANNQVYVLDGELLTRWNYNTGQLLGLVDGWNGTVLWAGPAQQPGRYIISFLSGFERWAWPLSPEGFVNPGIGTARNLERYSGGYIGFGSGGFRHVGATFALGAAVGHGSSLGFGTVATSDFGVSAVAPSLGTNGGVFTPIVGGSFGTSGSWTATSLANIKAVGSAHNGFYAIGQNANNAAQGRVTKMNLARSAFESHSFGEGVLVDPVGVATVVAPEPGTLAALALGALTLMRRRRR